MASVESSTTTTTSTSTTSSGYSYTTSSSDIDWDALIEVAVAAKEVPADTIDAKIADNEAKIASYEDMQSLLQDLVSAAETIRGTADSLLEQDDAFSLREAYLTSVGDVEAESAVVVTADSGVEIGSYDLQILQLASVEKVAGTEVEDNTSDLNYSGTFTLGLDDMEAVEFEVSEDMTLDEIAELINTESGATGVAAQVLKVSDDSYQLILSGSETGQSISMTSVSGDDIGAALGLTDETGAFTDILVEAQDAVISLDGIEITRSTNTIDDVIDGVSFALYQETGEDASITVEISNDLTTIKEAITALVDAYNAYREWALTQQEVSSAGGASDEATLFGDTTLRTANSAVSDALSTMIDSDSMALLGLSYDESNYLELDETTLNEVLLSDLDSVEDLLSFQMTSSSSDVALLTRSDSMPSSLNLEIEVDEDGELVGATVDGAEGLFEVSGSRIKGVEGTAYEGITFVFTGDVSQSVELSFTSGLVENLYNQVSKYSDPDEGLLAEMVTDITETNEDLESRADDIRDRADTYRDVLTERYANYQAAIEEAQSTLDYLTALLNTGDE